MEGGPAHEAAVRCRLGSLSPGEGMRSRPGQEGGSVSVRHHHRCVVDLEAGWREIRGDAAASAASTLKVLGQAVCTPEHHRRFQSRLAPGGGAGKPRSTERRWPFPRRNAPHEAVRRKPMVSGSDRGRVPVAVVWGGAENFLWSRRAGLISAAVVGGPCVRWWMRLVSRHQSRCIGIW